MDSRLRAAAKALAYWAATLAVLPSLASFYVRGWIVGPDRALEASSQALSLVPGMLGQYVRRAFFARALDSCHPSVTIEFGVLFSKVGARIDEQVYIGPRCHLGLVHIEPDVLIGPGVHLPSGRSTHGTADLTRPIREQPGIRTLVTIGRGSWIGASAVVMADIGRETIVGAGSVVTHPLPDRVVAVGGAARVIRSRDLTSVASTQAGEVH